jgi:hypothetical protein
LDTVRKRELEALRQDLLDVWSSDISGLLNLGNAEDLNKQFRVSSRSVYAGFGVETYVDGSEASTVAGGHVLVQRIDGVCSGHFAVLLVHVVCSRSRIVSDPDTKVLDLQRVLFGDLIVRWNQRHVPLVPLDSPTYLINADDLTAGVLDFPCLLQEIPESRLGDDGVRRKDSHAVELWGGIVGGRQMPSDDLVFIETTCLRHDVSSVLHFIFRHILYILQ